MNNALMFFLIFVLAVLQIRGYFAINAQAKQIRKLQTEVIMVHAEKAKGK